MYLITSQIILLCLLTISRVSAQAVTMEWAANLSGSGTETAKSIVLDVNGNVYTTGYFTGSVDFDPGPNVFYLSSAGYQDIFISKLNSAGDFVWAKRIGAYANDAANSITVDASGNVYICGFYHGNVDFNPNAGTANLMSATINSQDIFIAKYNSEGNFMWAKSIGGIGYYDIIGNLVDAVSVAYQVKLDSKGNVYAIGSFLGQIDFDPGPGLALQNALYVSHAFVVKLNYLGMYKWAKTFGEEMYGEEAYGITIDAIDRVFVTGVFAGSVDFNPNEASCFINTNAYNACFVLGLDEAGGFLWVDMIGGNSSNDMASGTCIVVNNNQDIVVAGNYKGSIDLDPGLNQSVQISEGNSDAFVIKLNAFGSEVWSRSFGGSSADYLYSICNDNLGNIYFTGSFKGSADFDPSLLTYIQNSAAANTLDAYIVKLNPAGNFVWACRWGGLLNDQCNAITVSTNNDLFIAGYYSGIADIDPGIAITNFTTAGSNDIVVEQLYQFVSGIPTPNLPNDEMLRINNVSNVGLDEPNKQIIVFPNPCNDILQFKLPKGSKLIHASMMNIHGIHVLEKLRNDSEMQLIDIQHLLSGEYYLQLKFIRNHVNNAAIHKIETQIIKVLKW